MTEIETSAAAKLKRYWAPISAGVAALALLVGQFSGIMKFGTEWVAPLFWPTTQVEIIFEAPADRTVLLAVDPDKASGRFAAVETLGGGQKLTFTLTAEAQHALQWQGASIKPAGWDIVTRARSDRWRLKLAGSDAGLDLLRMEPMNSSHAVTVSAQPVTAQAIVAANSYAAKQAGKPLALTGAIGREFSIIGIYEQGTPDCSDRVSLAFNELSIGCAGQPMAMFMGKLDPALIARTMGSYAPMLYQLAAPQSGSHDEAGSVVPPEQKPAFEAAVRALIHTPEFRTLYAQSLQDLYARAVAKARSWGLRSERGVLFILDRQINMGDVDRLLPADWPPPANGFSAADEQHRIQTLGAATIRYISHRPIPDFVKKRLQERVELISTGRGEARGISYDLDAIGIRADVPIL